MTEQFLELFLVHFLGEGVQHFIAQLGDEFVALRIRLAQVFAQLAFQPFINGFLDFRIRQTQFIFLFGDTPFLPVLPAV